MFELIKSGGWLMLPIILCSVVALAIIAERFWSLQRKRITPKHLLAQIWHWEKQGVLDEARIKQIRQGSPLGLMLSSALLNRHHPKEIMKESMEEATTHILPDLQRFLTTLGTIASITPLLGLLGTVLGMIQVFSAMLDAGVGNPRELAGGISTALITTAAGLAVAIPSLMFYRYFRGKVENLLIVMQQEALKLIEVMQGDREFNDEDENA